MKVRLSLVALLIAASPALAQPGAAPDDMKAFDKDLDALFVANGLTAEQAAGRAAAASPTVRRRNAEIEAAIANIDAARTAEIPQLKGTASYTRLSYIAPLSFGAIQIPFLQNQYVLQGQLGVPLSDYVFRFPKLVDAAKLGRDAALIGRQASEVSAGQDARLAYYEWLRARLQVLIAQRQLVQVQATLKQVQALADVQRLSKADLMRVQSQEAQAEQTVDQLTNLAELREEQLRLLIGAGDQEQLAIGEDIRKDVAAPGAGKLDDLMGRATKNRLELKQIDAGIAAKEAQRSAEKANLFPRLSGFAQVDYDRPNQRVFPQTDEFKYSWAAGLSLTWTINDALISRTTDHRLAAEASELRADKENLVRGTRIEVLAAQQAVVIAVHALQTTQKGLAAAEESYRVRRELLNAERATAVELVDAETDLTRARIAALNARVDLRVALAQLAHALGDDTKARETSGR